MHPAFCLLFFLPLASAMSGLSISSNPTSGGTATVSWTADSTDPSTFSIELATSDFHNAIAVANNVQSASGQTPITIPIVPTNASYTLQAVQINDVNSVLDTSAPFSIGATVSTTSSAATSSTVSSSGSVSSPTGSSASTTGSTSSLSLGSVTSSSSSSGASSPSASSFNGNNGALGTHIDSGKVGSIAAAVVGIVAGVVFV